MESRLAEPSRVSGLAGGNEGLFARSRSASALGGAKGYAMSTYVLMKILESAPQRYELGISILTLGRLEKAYDRLASHIEEGDYVLDIGCGTGALTLRAARKGARVKGIDVSAPMLAIAGERAKQASLIERIELCEMGVAELGAERPESYDVVMSGLCFSELSDDELAYTLREARRILKPGGFFLIGDEVRPEGMLKRIVGLLIRIPLAAIAYVVTQTTTRALCDLPERVGASGFHLESIRLDKMESFIEIVARKPEGDVA